MAIKLYNRYNPRANPGDANYPDGSIKNESIPGADDGTPLEKDWGNDIAGFTQRLLLEGGTTPSGNPDTVLNSDYYDSLQTILKRSGGKPFATVAELIADTKVKVGDFVSIESYTATNNSGVMFGKIVPSGTGFNGRGFIDLPNTLPLPLQLKQNLPALPSVKILGSEGDGVTNDDAVFANADAMGPITVPSGSYVLTGTVDVENTVTVLEGGILNISGLRTFNRGIIAGWYKIFETTDDLDGAGWIDDVSVVIRGATVKADWFADRVTHQDDIKTIPDQSNNINKAFRAAIGNMIPDPSKPGDFVSENPEGVLELGHGYYRVDKTVRWGYQQVTPSIVYYRLNGGRLKGQGPAASYLMRTDMASTDHVLFGAFYQNELTVANDFKVTAYNPDGVTDNDKFSSSAKVLVFFQGDSLIINNLWVSGAQTFIFDTKGVKRDGVGIQFSSCVDTYFDNIFIEFCTTGIGFHSSVVSGSNLELYHTLAQGIGIGNFDSDYGDSQVTQSHVNITRIQARATFEKGICVIEGSNEGGNINLGTSYFTGYDSEFSSNVGEDFCFVADEAAISGNFTGVTTTNYAINTFKSNGPTAFLGTDISPLHINGFKAANQTMGTSAGIINTTTATSVYMNINNLSINGCGGTLLATAATSGKVSFSTVHIANYVGQNDGSANRQLFVSQNSVDIDILGLFRDPSDTNVLNQVGFAAGGKVYLDFPTVTNLTRAVSGAAVVDMPQRVAFA